MAYRKKTTRRKYGKKTYKRNYRKKTYKRNYRRKTYKRNYRKKTYRRRGVVLRPVISKGIPAVAWNKIDTATIKTIDVLEETSKRIAATAALTATTASVLDPNKKRALDGAMAM